MANGFAFDMLAYLKKLKAAGVPIKQAEVHAETFAEIIEERLASKQDLKEFELRLKHDLTLRLGAMITGGITLISVLVTLF